MRYHKLIDDSIAIILILLLSYAATTKMVLHQKFIQDISSFPILGSVPKFIALSFPSLLLLTACLIIFERSRSEGFILSLIILTVTNTYLLAVIGFAEHVPCSCSGIWSNMGWTGNIIINVIFIAINIIGLVNRKRNISMAAVNKNVGF